MKYFISTTKMFQTKKYASLYSFRTQYIDLTKYFNTFSLKTSMKATCPMQHFLLTSYINLSVGNCSAYS